MSQIDAATLSGENLDYWVAKALGYEVVGKMLAFYDPDSGYPEFDPDQKPRDKGCLKTHERYFYVSECMCDVAQELHAEGFRASAQREETRYHGHHWQCFRPVMNYSTDGYYAMKIIAEHNIELTLNPQNLEGTKWLGTIQGLTLAGSTPIEAAMRVFVAHVLGTHTSA